MPADPEAARKLHDDIWDVAVHTSLKHGGMINEHHGVGLKLHRFMPAQYGAAWPLLQVDQAGHRSARHHEPGKVGFERESAS